MGNLTCPKCGKEIMPDRVFCVWCEAFIPAPVKGLKAGVFRRWVATAIDPTIAIIAFFILIAGGSADPNAGTVALILLLAYSLFFLWLLSRGLTFGKWIVQERVVKRLDGRYPGFGTMFLREVVGKAVSTLFLGLGYYWAIWDKDGQAWHDKIAGTVVVRKG